MTHDTLPAALGLESGTLSILLSSMQVVFTGATKPDNTLLAELHFLEFPPAVVDAAKRCWTGVIDDEITNDLYNVALAAKKRVNAIAKGKGRKPIGPSW